MQPKKFTYRSYGIAFDRYGLWSFDNEFLQNFVI